MQPRPFPPARPHGDLREIVPDVFMLTGSIKGPEGSDFEVHFAGRRRRTWGEPVHLLAASGTEGWRPRDDSREFKWTCTDGVLSNGDHDVDIVSEKKFDDFQLSLEYKVDKLGANSGVYLRGRYELQIIGNQKLEKHGNGAVYSRLPPNVNPFTKPGEWQKLEVTLVDRYVTVKLNGTTVHDNVLLVGITGGAIDPREHAPGPFVLQGDHGRVHFRNVVVRPAK